MVDTGCGHSGTLRKLLNYYENNSIFFCILLLVWLVGISAVSGQAVKKSQHALSKKASKGYLFKIDQKVKSSVRVTYKIPGDKKKEEMFFEKYTFGNDLAFSGSAAANIAKTTKENQTINYYYAVVAGAALLMY